MTTEELRELDAFIAEHVMGWKPAISPLQSRDETVPRYWNKGNGGFKMVSMNGFTPSTDPADAMLVLEKCVTEAPMEIQIDRKRSKDGPFRIECGVGATLKLSIAETLPLAVALFAKQLFHNKKETP